MNILSFTWLSMKGRKTNVLFTIIAIMLAVALTLSVMALSVNIEKGIKQQAGTYDVIVGAKGSPMQVVLNSLLYLETPTGNIPYSIYESVEQDERVLKAVPIALGDSYYGLPIVGTTKAFFTPFRSGLPERFQLQAGSWFNAPGEVVLGAKSAELSGLQLHDTFHGNHGLGESGEEHEELEYKVVGILAASGGADDRAIFTPLQSVWAAHDHGAETGDVTAILIKPEQLGYVPKLQEEWNALEGVQAVYPVRIFRQLLETFSFGKTIALMLAGVSIILAGLFIVFAVINSVAERRKETETLRALGVTRRTILLNVLLEGMFIAGAGSILGVLLSQVMYYASGAWSKQNLGITLPVFSFDAAIVQYTMLLFGLSVLVSFIPMLWLYRRKADGRAA